VNRALSGQPVPLTELTGFLGSGKTTLLNTLLKDPALKGALVLVNEIGEIGLDHLLMEKVAGDVIALAGGCLCCTVRSDLIDTLEDLLARRAEGELEFSRIVLETTGLADPVPVLHSLIVHPNISLRVALDGVLTTVDAVLGARTLQEHEEARRQAALADRIILTKTDLAEAAAARAELAALLDDIAPNVPRLDAAKGEARPENLFDIAPFAPGAKAAAVAGWLAAGARAAAPSHNGDIRTTTLWSEAALPPRAFGMFVDLLRAEHGAKILRLKGLVRTTDDPERPVVIHGVQHLFHPPRRLAAWPDEDRRTRIVLIGQGIDAGLIQRLYDAFAGVPGLDAPDRSALIDNPLAPPGLRRG
jgi:G3E family GTPase